MAEKNLIDRGTSRRPAPAASAVSVAPLHNTAAEPWWLPGVVGGSTSGEPAWAAFAREAVAAAPRDVVVADRAYPGLSGFGPIVAPFVEAAAERLRDALADGEPEGDGAPVLADFRRQLTRRLARIAARTLVTELHEARRLGRLSGEGPEERFRDFVALTARRDGLDRLVTGYPVLARLLATACLNTASAFAELVARLAADRHLLAPAGVFGEPDVGPGGLGPSAGPGALTGVEAGAGDSHRGGRSVMLLRFADGTRLVYKPRPLAAHRHFNSLVEWFGSLPGAPDLRVLRVLDRGDYGWAEFVAERPCSSGAETRQFYRRQGALLALLHALDGTDLHHENLIACGPHPVLVDVETLFHPALGPARSADPAARALHDSVHRVGLLPQLLVGDTTALDMSAIGGGRAASSPIETADWAETGTDRMRLVRRAGRFTESANRPRLGAETADPSAYTDALCDGFRAGYTAIHDHRDELLAPDGPLRRFAGDEVRVVPRPTWTYTTLLDESTHPDLMRDAAERHRVLSLLRTPLLGVPALSGVEDEEIAELWCGDVPVFATRPGSGRLWSGTGRTVTGSASEGSAPDARRPHRSGARRGEGARDGHRGPPGPGADHPDRHGEHLPGAGAPARPGRPDPECGDRAGARATALRRTVGGRPARLPRLPARGPYELDRARTARRALLAAHADGGGPRGRLHRPRALPGPTGRAHRRVPVRGSGPRSTRAGSGAAGRPARAGRRTRGPGLRRLRGPRRHRVRPDRGGHAAGRPGGAGPGRSGRPAELCGERGRGRVRGARRRGGGLVSLLAVYRATGRPQAVVGRRALRRAARRRPGPGTGGFADGAAGIGWALLRLAGPGATPATGAPGCTPCAGRPR
ncbi:type 2 lantibiotic biosynthesis protein LanM [Streptomyces sp. Termitarium-T10T-6]|nr:type 2 lantibiotic biosynthesis protein LanM [Streptomyces sp. Termitarium-T10T-6]